MVVDSLTSGRCWTAARVGTGGGVLGLAGAELQVLGQRGSSAACSGSSAIPNVDGEAPAAFLWKNRGQGECAVAVMHGEAVGKERRERESGMATRPSSSTSTWRNSTERPWQQRLRSSGSALLAVLGEEWSGEE